MSVSMYPGAITFTVTPRDPNSLDKDLENPDVTHNVQLKKNRSDQHIDKNKGMISWIAS